MCIASACELPSALAIDQIKSSITADRTSGIVANDIDASLVVATFVDTNGHALNGLTATLNVAGSSNLVSPTNVLTDSDGSASFHVSSTHAETKTITATISLGSDSVTLSKELSVAFVSGPTSSQQSSMTATPTEVVANGNQQATIQVLLVDQFKNARAGEVVLLSLPGTSIAVNQATATTDESGAAVFSATSTVVQMATATATVDGVALTANINFTAAWTIWGNVPIANLRTIGINAADANAVYVGSASGKIYSLSGGVWNDLGAGFSGVNAIAVDSQTPGTIYVASPDGVHRTTDGGSSWATINAGLPGTLATDIVLDPSDSTTLYVATTAGVARKTSASDTWTAINSGLTQTSILSLAVDPANVTTVYAGTTDGIFKKNAADVWTEISSGLGASPFVYRLAVDATSPTTVYAGLLPGGVFVKDQSDNWSGIDAGLSDLSVEGLSLLQASTPQLFVATENSGVFSRATSGTTFASSSQGIDNPNLENLSMSSDGTAYAVGFGGAYRRAATDVVWTKMIDGLSGSNVVAVAVDPSNPTLYAAVDGAGVFQKVTTSSAGTWTSLTAGLANLFVRGLAFRSGVAPALYASTSDGVYALNGTTWQVADTGIPTKAVTALLTDSIDTAVIYAATGEGVYQTTGDSWALVGVGLTTKVQSLAEDKSASPTLYAGTASGVYKISLAGTGSSWSLINSGLTNLNIQAMTVDASVPPTVYAGTFNGVFKKNSDDSWSPVDSGLTSVLVHALAADLTTPGIVYAGTSGGVFKKTNAGGDAWMGVNWGLPQGQLVDAIAIDPNNSEVVYVGTGGAGVYRAQTGGQ